MQYPPVAVLLSYPTPNYVNPEQHGPALIITLSILFPSALLVVGLRTYTRVIIAKSFGWDDGIILVAFVRISNHQFVHLYPTVKAKHRSKHMLSNHAAYRFQQRLS